MIRRLIPLLLPAILVLLFSIPSNNKKEKAGKYPNEWFRMQRAYPFGSINYEARDLALEQFSEKKQEGSPLRNSEAIFEGPVNTGGRISALAMHPDDVNTVYAGAASGGVFKSINGGASWDAIADDLMSLSIGDIEIALSDPDVIYVGTGEANAGGGSLTYDGFGMYRSDDAGATWEHIGLTNSGSIGRIAVHPQDPDIVYVAAMGRLFSNNMERGIFKTVDGGQNWEKVLYLSSMTGGIDVLVHPGHPDTVYAAMWQRERTPEQRTYGGIECGIYRSYDGGDNWAELTSGLPSPSPNAGRIGIDISRSDPEILYAIYADKTGYFDGIFKTTDNGDNWAQTNDGNLSGMYSSYGWWFGRIAVDPTDPDNVFGIGFDLYKTDNGGQSWYNTSGPVHVDQHDIIIHPLNNEYIVLGNDGGVYTSFDGGAASSWDHLQNIPITQFYTCEIDEQNPERLYGGTQDNGTNRTMTGSIDDWEHIYWGDGFYVLVDPEDNDYVYAEYQYGNFARSTNGGNSFTPALTGISSEDRKNWNTPVVFDPLNPEVLYYGANRLYRSPNRAVSWQVISPDLTNGPGSGNQVYGTITTIDVAKTNTDFIYTGTDDGNVWVTQNGGNDWINISDDLPERWVTRVAVDPYDENTAYLTLSGYRRDSYQPHVLKTEDAGQNWTDISGDLPEAPVNDIIIDPDYDSTLYVATDFGVYVTWSEGEKWFLLDAGLPNVPVPDLDLHVPTRKLVIATYGRSMYSIMLDQYVGVPGKADNPELKIYPNPAAGHITIDPEQEGRFTYKIYNSSGRMVMDGSTVNNQRIDISGLSKGIYVLRTGYGGVKFIKE